MEKAKEESKIFGDICGVSKTKSGTVVWNNSICSQYVNNMMNGMTQGCTLLVSVSGGPSDFYVSWKWSPHRLISSSYYALQCTVLTAWWLLLQKKVRTRKGWGEIVFSEFLFCLFFLSKRERHPADIFIYERCRVTSVNQADLSLSFFV